MVDALEKTDYVGTIGRWQFYGKNDQFTHALKYGEGYITGINLQWQNGKQVAIWPKSVATAKVKFPAFVKVQAASN
jgi:branched-chain amino acid transport system substrate-binding protein